MRKVYSIVIERLVLQRTVLTRSDYDSEGAVEKAVEEVNDNAFYLGWEDVEIKDIEVIRIDIEYPERDE